MRRNDLSHLTNMFLMCHLCIHEMIKLIGLNTLLDLKTKEEKIFGGLG